MLPEQIGGQNSPMRRHHPATRPITLIHNILRCVVVPGLSETSVPARGMFVKAADNLRAPGWAARSDFAAKTATQTSDHKVTQKM